MINMWKCKKCGRIFEKTEQVHSCRSIPLAEHFKNKKQAKEIFDFLVRKINSQIGKVKIVSLPCCVHLFGKYDFLAALPKKDSLEIRFANDSRINDSRVRLSVPVSQKNFKICLEVNSKKEIDGKVFAWLKHAYFFKDKPR